MHKKSEHIVKLAAKWESRTISEAEQLELDNWYREHQDDPLEVPGSVSVSEQEHQAKIWNAIQGQIQEKRVRLWPRIAIAAAIATIIFGAGLFMYKNQQNGVGGKSFAFDKAPGRNTATLKLSNGKTIALSDVHSGVVIKNETLSYDDGTGLPAQPGSVDFAKELTANTPRGGTYQVELPDGTKVWLNAQSSLSFPATFEGGPVRKVRLTGEAYFQVAKQKGKQFIVASQGQEVTVLGTHFNVSGYPGEPVKTTLVEGKVSVTTEGQETNHTILLPGQQATLTNATLLVRPVDTDEALAWKNGEFMFNNEPLYLIMKQISRWYDIEVAYENPDLKNKQFNGGITRFSKVSKVLAMLQRTGRISFELKENTIIVKEN